MADRRLAAATIGTPSLCTGEGQWGRLRRNMNISFPLETFASHVLHPAESFLIIHDDAGVELARGVQPAQFSPGRGWFTAAAAFAA